MMHPRYFTLAEAAKRMPGPRCSTQKIYRISSKGVIGPDGEIVRLRSIKAAGRRLIPEDAIDEFVAACSARPSVPPADGRGVPADRQQNADSEAAKRAALADEALRNLGF